MSRFTEKVWCEILIHLYLSLLLPLTIFKINIRFSRICTHHIIFPIPLHTATIIISITISFYFLVLSATTIIVQSNVTWYARPHRLPTTTTAYQLIATLYLYHYSTTSHNKRQQTSHVLCSRTQEGQDKLLVWYGTAHITKKLSTSFSFSLLRPFSFVTFSQKNTATASSRIHTYTFTNAYT